MKCEKCREIKMCRTIFFGGVFDDGKKLYLCEDCANWLYSYIINNVFDDSNDDSDCESEKVYPSLCLSCKKIYSDCDDISDNICKHCEYHEWYGRHYR